MSIYIGIDEGVVDVSGTSAAALTGVQARVRDNARHTSQSRLKRAGVSFVPGLSDEATATAVRFDNFTGPLNALLSYDAAGVAVTGADIRSVGLWVATPVNRSLCWSAPFPLAANTKAVRIVLCSWQLQLDDNIGAVQVLAHVWDGEGWYPCPPGADTLEPLTIVGQESADTMQFRADLRATDSFKSIDRNNVTGEGCRWDALAVLMPQRDTVDRTVQREFDNTNVSRVVLSFLSVPDATVTVTSATTIDSVIDTRLPKLAKSSHQMPSLARDGASVLWGIVVGDDGVRRWHFLPGVLSNEGATALVNAACWPPLKPAETTAGQAIDLVYASTLLVSSIGISELGT